VAPTGFAGRTKRCEKGLRENPQGDEPATQSKNYITPHGLQRRKDEHRFLLTRERAAVTEVVASAARNADRSESADYQYGKRRLRQIDGRIRFLTKRIEAAEVVDPANSESRASSREGILWSDRALRQCRGSRASGAHRGRRRGRSQRNHISWVSPLGRLADEGGSGRKRSSPSAARYRIADRAGCVLRAHFGGTVP
jgi:transcription elongation factor GreB